MNKARRKSLTEIKDKIEDLKTDIELLLDEEQDYLDTGFPENIQSGERYEKAEAAVSALEDAISSLEEAVESIDTAIE